MTMMSIDISTKIPWNKYPCQDYGDETRFVPAECAWLLHFVGLLRKSCVLLLRFRWTTDVIPADFGWSLFESFGKSRFQIPMWQRGKRAGSLDNRLVLHVADRICDPFSNEKHIRTSSPWLFWCRFNAYWIHSSLIPFVAVGMSHYLLSLWLCLSNQMTILARSNNNLLWSLSSPSAYTHIAGAGPLPCPGPSALGLGCPCSFGL